MVDYESKNIKHATKPIVMSYHDGCSVSKPWHMFDDSYQWDDVLLPHLRFHVAHPNKNLMELPAASRLISSAARLGYLQVIVAEAMQGFSKVLTG